MYCSYRGGFAPHISTVQNTQAPSEFLTTSIPKQKPWILLIFAKIKSSKLKVCRFLLGSAKVVEPRSLSNCRRPQPSSNRSPVRTFRTKIGHNINFRRICMYLKKTLATFNLARLILDKLRVAMVFALELKLSKTLRGLVYFVLQLQWGLRPLYKYGTKYTSPLRFF